MTGQSISWRDVIKVHPAADLFPMMPPDELKELGEDIKKHGQRVSVVLADGKGKPHSLLDGRNRLDAMETVGLPVLNNKGNWFHPDVRFVTERGDPYAFVISANIHRRHLTSEQKRDLIAAAIKAQPKKSNRAIAKQVKADDKTVGSVRRELEGRAEIPHVSTVEDTKGRKQPAKKPPTKKRRTVDDYLFEKAARLAAPEAVPTEATAAPVVASDVTTTIMPVESSAAPVSDNLNPLHQLIEDLREQLLLFQSKTRPDAEFTSNLAGTLKRTYDAVQVYAQGIGNRVDVDVSIQSPGSDGLEIPPFLRRSHAEASTAALNPEGV